MFKVFGKAKPKVEPPTSLTLHESDDGSVTLDVCDADTGERLRQGTILRISPDGFVCIQGCLSPNFGIQTRNQRAVVK
jgi:hypothetical protein